MISENVSQGEDKMCYKDEVQRKNADKLKCQFKEENVPEFIQRFFIRLDSEAGKLNYWIAIRDLLYWCMEQNIIKVNRISDIRPEDMIDIESEDVTQYLKQKEIAGLSPTTLNTRKNIFSSFWRYMKNSRKLPIKTNIISEVSYKGIATNQNVFLKMPADQEIKAMEEKIKTKKDIFVRERNLIILRVLKGTGLRESELAGLDVEDLYLEGGEEDERPYIKVLGKGKYRTREMRKVLITNDVVCAFRAWEGYRDMVLSNDKKTRAVFLNRNGERLSEDNIKAIFKHYGGGLTPHMIRHWYATVMGKKLGAAFVQQQLGHKNVDVTIGVYTDGTFGAEKILSAM